MPNSQPFGYIRDWNCHYKSVANQIIHDAGLAPIPYNGRKFRPHQRSNQHVTSYIKVWVQVTCLIKECSLYSKDRPPAARNLPLHQILKHHANTAPFTKFMESIFRQLQDRNNNIKLTNSVNLPWYTSWWNTGCTFYFVDKKNKCFDLLDRIANEQDFFSRVITGDESWIFLIRFWDQEPK